MSNQVELRASIPEEMADPLEDYFCETESQCWGIMQKEITDPYELFGIFPDEATASAALAVLRKDFKSLPADFELSEIVDADWQNAYKEFVKPWSDRQLHWIPLWERDNLETPADAAVVYLDAGMAFGTGAHETTRLCARRLQDYRDANSAELESLEVIDAGCGSGVLALSASVLGFKKILGFDFDPQALTDRCPNISQCSGIVFALFIINNSQGFARMCMKKLQYSVLIGMGGKAGDQCDCGDQTGILQS